MKIIRKLTNKQLWRVKMMSSATIVCVVFSTLVQQIANANNSSEVISAAVHQPPTQYNGRYVWPTDQTENTAESLAVSASYLSKDRLCSGQSQLVGLTNLSEGFLGVALLLLLLYLFIGIAIVTEYMYEAIAFITSSTDRIEVKDLEGKSMVIGQPKWNATMVNLSLLGIGSALPEIFLCFLSQFGRSSATGVPLEIGSMALIGSASFNLLVVSGLSIIGVSSIKFISKMNVFLVTAAFACFAYVWLFVVLVVITPGYVTLTEALVTLLFYPMLLCFAWVTEKCSSEKIDQAEDLERTKKYMARQALVNIAQDKGKLFVLQAATGSLDKSEDEIEVERIENFYRVALGLDNLREASLEELVQAIEPECPVEQISHRRAIASFGSTLLKPFANKYLYECSEEQEKNESLGFKSTHYIVAQHSGSVGVIIEKRTEEEMSFWMETINQDCSSYEPFKQKITMKAHEFEREVSIKIKPVKSLEQEEFFKVILKDESKRQLYGCDSSAIVEITHTDSAGTITFAEPVYHASVDDKHLKVSLRRVDGGSGPINCIVSTSFNFEMNDGKTPFTSVNNTKNDIVFTDQDQQLGSPNKRTSAVGPTLRENRAQEGVDFTPIYNHLIEFADCQAEASFNIELPDSSLKDSDGYLPENFDPLCFMLELNDSEVGNVTVETNMALTRQKFCLVKLGSKMNSLSDLERRQKFIQKFLYLRSPSWCDQFKLACSLTPSIEDTEYASDVSGWELFAHIIAVPWRFFFAIIPPRKYGQGWLALATCVVFIAALTYVMSEIILTLGCFLNIAPVLQGLVIVSLGTSVPQAVWSLRQNESKENIANNVFLPMVAANAANIFIGLGLPWTISSVYRYANNGEALLIGKFETGHLAFAAATFLVISVIAFLILGCRRIILGGELGGNKFSRIVSAFVLFTLWGAFISLNVTNTYKSWEMFAPPISPISAIQMSCPSRMNVPITSTFASDMKVEWDLPETDNQIIRVEVEALLPSTQTWKAMSQYCSTSSCHIPQQKLFWENNMENCHLAQFRVKACTHRCCSMEWSQPNIIGARVQGCPSAFQLSETPESKTASSLSLQWEQLTASKDNECNAVAYHQIEKRRPGEAWRNELPQQEKLNKDGYTFQNLQQCTTYEFRHRAHNSLCPGRYSDHYEVTTECAGLESKHIPHVSTVEGCSVKIDWTHMIPMNSDLQKTEVSIRGNDESYYHIDFCDSNDGTSACNVNMKFLEQEPFNLKENDLIQARVKIGEEIYSDPSADDIKFIMGADSVLEPSASDPSATSVSLSWSAPGSAPITDYEVHWTAFEGAPYTFLHKTKLTSHTVKGLAPDANYQFKIRALNVCGPGEFSPPVSASTFAAEPKEIQVSTQVKKIKAMNVSAWNCQVRLTWTPPPDGRSPIERYRIQARDRFNRFHSLNQLCGQQGNQMACEIPMRTFTEEPLNLLEGERIFVRASAFMDNGWGPNSDVNTDGATVMGTPNQIPPPTVTPVSASSVRLQWARVTPESNSDRYVVQQSNTPNQQWIDISTERATFYTVDRLVPGRTYLFRVMVRNACGSRSSEAVPITMPTSARQSSMQTNLIAQCGSISLSIEGCNVNFRWTNDHSNLPINSLRYDVKVQNKQGVFVKVPSCGDNHKLQCAVPIKTLKVPHFNLLESDLIVAKVRACDFDGRCGLYSPTSTDPVRVKSGAPLKMPPPVWVNMNAPVHNNVKLQWANAVPNANPWETPYELMMCTGTGCNNFIIIAKTGQTQYTVPVQPGIKNYRFTIQARTPCGTSQASEARTVTSTQACDLPSIPVNVRRGTGCSVEFTWTSPINCGTVTNYRFKLRGGQGLFDIPQCTSQGAFGRCVVKMTQIAAAPYFLQIGQQVIAQIEAQSPIGGIWSKPAPSPWSGVTMLPTSCGPIQMKPATFTQNEINLSWAPVNGAEGYDLFWDEGIAGGEMVQIDIQRGASTHIVPISNVNSGAIKRDFIFRMRARCACGPSEFAELPVVVIAPKVTMSQPKTFNEGCQVKITWMAPSSSSPVTQYNVAVEDIDRQFQPLQNCGNNGELQCLVPMEVLTSAPFRLSPGHLVKAKVRAFNSAGWSLWSPPNWNTFNGAKILSVPGIPSKPVQSELTTDSVVLTWAQTTQGTTQLHWDACAGLDSSNGFYPLDPSQINFRKLAGTSYQIQGLPSGKVCKFRVIATNDCGSQYSMEEFVAVKSKPGVISLACPVISGCRVVTFNWQQPTNPVNGYRFSINDQNQVPQALLKCGLTPTQTSCTIPIAQLMSHPFNLRLGDMIYGQVAGQNDAGFGEPSTSGECPKSRITAGPCKPTGLELITDEKNKITVRWATCPGPSMTNYELYWDAGKTGSNQYQLLSERQLATYTVDTSGNESKEFHFYVQAVNECGKGQSSKHLVVKRQSIPLVMPCVRVATQKCAVFISWKPPSRDSLTYEVGIANRGGHFVNWQACSTTARCGPEQCDCQIHMKNLIGEPFSLQLGDNINARVRSRNQVGYSDFSEQCPDLSPPMMLGLPEMMDAPVLTPVTSSQLKVSWEPCSGAGCYYQLSFGVKGAMKKSLTIPGQTLEQVMPGLTPGLTYEFCIRSWNDCGCPKFACADTRICKEPSDPASMLSKAGDCAISITWEAAMSADGMTPFQYQMSINSRPPPVDGVTPSSAPVPSAEEADYVQYDLNQCTMSKSIPPRYICHVTMKTLRQAPFNLRENDLVYARVRAKNDCGWSQPGSAATVNVRVSGPPQSPPAPFFKQHIAGGVRVCWNPPLTDTLSQRDGGSQYNYYLFWNGGNQKGGIPVPHHQYQKVVGPSNLLCHSMPNLTPSKYHQFFVKAENACGQSVPSQPVQLSVQKPPSPPTCTLAGTSNCGVLVTCFKPTTGTPTDSFRVEIGAKDATFIEYPGKNCKMMIGQVQCLIGMRALQTSPFNLHVDDVITARAASCNNQLGCGPVTDVQSNLKIRAGPGPIEIPTEVNKGIPGQISVKWGVCTEPHCHYELEVQEDNEPARRAILYVNSHVERNINPKKIYKFVARACNNCGFGKKTPALVVKACVRPLAPVSMQDFGPNCSVNVSWHSAPTPVCPISRHEIQVQDGTGHWRPLPTCGTDGALNCNIPMSHFLTPSFGLVVGQSVITRARSENCCGWSDWSHPAQGVALTTSPAPPVTPTTSNLTPTSFTVNVADTNYELHCDNGEGTDFVIRPKNNGRQYLIQIQPSVLTYQCFALNKNACGTEKTPIISVNVCRSPSQPKTIVTEEDQCRLRVAWSQERQTPLSRYVVEIESGLGQWHEFKDCVTTTTNSCDMKMSLLKQAPFSLLDGGMINVRVTASNKCGASPPSLPHGNVARVIGVPTIPNKPEAVVTASSIQLCWNKQGVQTSLTSPAQKYELFWGVGERPMGTINPISSMDNVERTTETCYSINPYQPGQTYRFIVRAINNCGSGYSPEVFINTSNQLAPTPKSTSDICQTNPAACWGAISPSPAFPAEAHHEPDSTDGWTNMGQIGHNDVLAPNENVLPPTQWHNQPILPLPIVSPSNMDDSASQSGWQSGTMGGYNNQFDSHDHGSHLTNNNPEQLLAAELDTMNTMPCEIPETPDAPRTNRNLNVVSLEWYPRDLLGNPLLQGEPDLIYQLHWSNSLTGKFVPLYEGATPYFAMNVRPNAILKFKVRARRSCGSVSNWSEIVFDPESAKYEFKEAPIVPVEKKPVPAPVPRSRRPSTRVRTSQATQTCGIRIDWELPQATGSPVVYQRVEVKARNGQFYSTNLNCGTSSYMTYCVVPASTLRYSPYYLRVGQLVVAKVSVVYSGWTVTYKANASGARLGAVPSGMRAPKIKIRNDNSLFVKWNTPYILGGSEIVKYELAWDKGASFSSVDSSLKVTQSLNFTTEPFSTGKTYRFAVRSSNQCGYGAYSTASAIAINRRPEMMDTVTVKADKDTCGIKIDWKQPDDGGESITEYKIEVLGEEGFQVLKSCGQSSETLCNISMDMLSKDPYNLKVGDQIAVQASAKNKIGWSSPSGANSEGARLTRRPLKMPQPKVISKNGDSITLTWGSLFGSANGGSKLTSYKLQWKDGVNDDHQKIVKATHQTDTIRGVVAGRKYLIRIAALNSCGIGPYSDELKVSAAGCPTQPPAPVIKVKGKDVMIKWEESKTEESSPLREYQVLLKNKDGSYMEHKRYCNGASSKIMQTRTCLIPMLKVPQLTGLEPRDLIQGKVRAINRNCQGDFSATNTEGQKVVACPAQMTPVRAGKKDITRSSVTVNWDSMMDVEAGGEGLHITEFEVRWRRCESDKWQKSNTSMTSNLHFSHTGLENAQCYQYMVRAYNQYCSGEWSETNDFISGQPPESLDAPAVKIVEKLEHEDDKPAFDVMISWPSPDTESKVTGYAIYIGTSSGEYKEDKSLCDGMDPKVIKTRKCQLPMSTFWNGTFRKDQGTLISVKVQAFNSKGRSELSPWNVEGAKVEKVPFQMNKPSGTRKANENAIILEWNDMRNPLDGGSPVITYDLQFKKHSSNEDWQEVVGLSTPYLQTMYTHGDRKPDQVLHYRIRAKNRWGWGQFSTPNLVMETAKAPERVGIPETSTEPQTGAVSIEWEVPDDNGSGITDYNVEVKAADTTWHETSDCKSRSTIMQSTDTSRQLLVCKVQMSTLRNKFHLPFDQLVEIRIRALNLAGKGPWSRVNNVGVTVKSEPKQMKKPLRGQQTSETRIHVKWDNLFLKEETGDSMILGYVLQDDNKEIYSGTETQAIFESDGDKIYKLRVAARNIYGLSKWSDVLNIKAGAIPPEVSTIESTNIANNRIEVIWDKPGKDVIEEYEVQIFVKSKDMFEVVPDLCDGSDPIVVEDRTCTLSSKVLNRQYGYHHGDLLIIKVRARNSLGWGAWSKPNTTGATVFKLVPQGG